MISGSLEREEDDERRGGKKDVTYTMPEIYVILPKASPHQFFLNVPQVRSSEAYDGDLSCINTPSRV